jgi:hypothetical protein
LDWPGVDAEAQAGRPDRGQVEVERAGVAVGEIGCELRADLIDRVGHRADLSRERHHHRDVEFRHGRAGDQPDREIDPVEPQHTEIDVRVERHGEPGAGQERQTGPAGPRDAEL